MGLTSERSTSWLGEWALEWDSRFENWKWERYYSGESAGAGKKVSIDKILQLQVVFLAHAIFRNLWVPLRYICGQLSEHEEHHQDCSVSSLAKTEMPRLQTSTNVILRKSFTRPLGESGVLSFPDCGEKWSGHEARSRETRSCDRDNWLSWYAS